jgi:hypothetical protein
MAGSGTETRQEARRSPDDPAEAVAAVVEDVGRLARAELRLAATEARAWLVRIGFGLVLLWLSLLLLQVFVCLLALSPLLFVGHPWPNVVVSLGLSLVLAAGASLFAVRELRSLKEVSHDREPE